jgi:uncharacterized ion transporter superfamily protein YfcC
MVLAMILTWIVPAGKYDTLADSSILDPSSYHSVEQSPVSIWGLLSAVYGGMSNAASIIVFTFLVGGYFNVLIESKAVDGFLSFLTRKLGDKSMLILPVLALIMSLLGATGVMANPVVAVIPIGILLAKKLKMDQIVGLGVMYLAAYGGYATSPICAMTVQVAQKIADLPLLSGFGFRCVIWVVFFIPTVLYLMHYARKIQKDPSKSVMGADYQIEADDTSIDHPFTWRHALALIGLVIGLGVYTYGSLTYSWGMANLATILLLVAVFAAVVTGMGTEGFVKGFLRGAQQLTFSAVLIGLASGVSVILTNGSILHTIIYGMSLVLNNIPHVLAGPIMFWFNLLFNFFVNSGSGQATVIMPIMAPLADVVGVTRQAAVTAFQLGDGLSNIVFPTSGTMMACLALAGVSYKKWIKWVLPLFLIWVAMGTITIILVVASGVA